MRIAAHEIAKPLYVELHRAVWRAGGHAIGQYLPNDDADANLPRDFYELASDEQLDFLPATYMRGLVDQLDHQVSVLSDTDMHALEGIDPARIMRHGRSLKPYMDWRTEKENAGRFTWTLGLYGTAAMAAEAGLTEQEYWQQIIDACFLDEPDPIARWREVTEPDQRLHRAPQRAADRAPARRRRGRRPAHHARRAAPLGRRHRPQHPELRDLHEPRLARDRGLDRLQPAALPLRQPRARHPPASSATAA